MNTDYDRIAAQYKRAKHHPWRMHIEHFTFFQLLGDVRGKTVLDLACGEGFFSRFIKEAGAARVVGVDISQGMIELARAEESRQPLGIDYHVHDVKTLRLAEKFDLVVAAYLLNYCAAREELLQMCQAIAACLKPGCRFVTVNNNPAVENFDGTKYGFTKSLSGEVREGKPVIYTILLEEGPFDIANYHLSIATHEWALATAGLHDVRWHQPRLSPTGSREFGLEFWQSFLDQPPVIFLEAKSPPAKMEN